VTSAVAQFAKSSISGGGINDAGSSITEARGQAGIDLIIVGAGGRSEFLS
jgi:hypothetical protein